jgi:hypothetical protein
LLLLHITIKTIYDKCRNDVKTKMRLATIIDRLLELQNSVIVHVNVLMNLKYGVFFLSNDFCIRRIRIIYGNISSQINVR